MRPKGPRPGNTILVRAAALVGLVLVWGSAGGAARAEPLRYALDLPDRESVTYVLDLEVRHPGTLTVRADWTGRRSLSLKLTPPGQPYGSLLRSGPSPQTLEAAIDAEGFEPGTWTLRVFSLADRGAGSASLLIGLPEPAPSPARRPAAETPPPPPVEQEPWMTPRAVPSSAPSEWRPFLEATERFRDELLGEGNVPPEDVCRWQVPLMRYLAERRERLFAGSGKPSRKTSRFLARLVEAIGSVEALRGSDDPLVVGPAPSDPLLENAWLKLRTTRIDPVEDELDELLGLLRNGHAPELEAEEWPLRMVSCLTACERYFEQRPRLGDQRAGNRELALAQWPRLLGAGEALAALAELTPGRRAAGD